ncbi:MAG: hypothetical protein HKM24_04815 [Gammaproteobacteria bacterium]|nr:hypothetical protein [Gammaproteobacteria bacterium]
MKVILMHGKDTDPTQKWYPWFINSLKERGIDIKAPVLPKADDPICDEWIAKLKETNPEENSILVGHSRGGVAILRWLEMLPSDMRVRKVILVATNSPRLKDKARLSENDGGFYTDAGCDFEAIKVHCDDFVVLHSKDDQWVPYSHGEYNAGCLDAKFISFDDKGHFGHGVDDIPDLLAEIENVLAGNELAATSSG